MMYCCIIKYIIHDACFLIRRNVAERERTNDLTSVTAPSPRNHPIKEQLSRTIQSHRQAKTLLPAVGGSRLGLSGKRPAARAHLREIQVLEGGRQTQPDWRLLPLGSLEPGGGATGVTMPPGGNHGRHTGRTKTPKGFVKIDIILGRCPFVSVSTCFLSCVQASRFSLQSRSFFLPATFFFFLSTPSL